MKDDMIQGYRCRCYDNGGKTLDRYTVVLLEHAYAGSGYYYGQLMALSLSEGGVAYSEFTSAVPGKHLGRHIAFNNLDDATKGHINARLKEN